jgi:hypothetical protein
MKFKNWLKLREIAVNTWLSPELQSFKHTIVIGTNTALPGVFSNGDLPPTAKDRKILKKPNIKNPKTPR